jgi:hypothetical protein
MGRMDRATDLDIGADNVIYVQSRFGIDCRISADFVNYVANGDLKLDGEPFYWAAITSKNEPIKPEVSRWEVQQAARSILDMAKCRYNLKVEKHGVHFKIERMPGVAPLPPAVEQYFKDQGVAGAHERKLAFIRLPYEEFLKISRTNRKSSGTDVYDWSSMQPGDEAIITGYSPQRVRWSFNRWNAKQPTKVTAKIMTSPDKTVHVFRIF